MKLPMKSKVTGSKRPLMWRLASVAGLAGAAALAGCASYPMPIQRMSDAEAAARTAEDTGVATSPQAQLHLRLAREGIARAKELVANGDYHRADFVLIRAKSDAELALAETRGQVAESDAQRAVQDVSTFQANNMPPTTTTTSATVPSPAIVPAPTVVQSTTTTTTQGGKP